MRITLLLAIFTSARVFVSPSQPMRYLQRMTRRSQPHCDVWPSPSSRGCASCHSQAPQSYSFPQATGLKENEEANFYLDSAEYDLPKAVAAYREDLAWDNKRNPNSLNSCVKRLASTPTPSEAPSISTPAEAAITPSSFSPHPAACYVGCPPPTYDFTDTTTADTTHPRRPRPNLLQELFCFCFFSPRTRR